MTLSLHHATVPTFIQVLTPVLGLIAKARAHCTEMGLPDTALTEARLAPDMWPLGKQIMASCQHSAGAVLGVQADGCGPDLTPPPTSFDALEAAVAQALETLRAVTPADIDSIAGNDTCFRFGETRMDYTVEDYLLTFALPNFFFHVSMVYAVLRNQGLQIGKRDWLGAPRRKG
ncbi:MAG: DUF1993 family protein [Novosphingobium sp.]